MSSTQQLPAPVPWYRAAQRSLGEFFDRPGPFGYLLITPALVILAIFIAYPFVLSIWLSMSNKLIGQQAQFVGLDNFARNWDTTVFRQTVSNTFIYTIFATAFKMVLGLAAALTINQRFRFRKFTRSALLLPWIVPTALSTLAWLWIFDPTYSILNWIISQLGAGRGFNWLGDPKIAMGSVIAVNVWRGVPFFAISILAALQTISPELYEAAAIDGAGAWRRFLNVTLPEIQPVLMVVLLFSIIWTFSDFQVVYILTRGGPLNMTHLFATLSYDVGLRSAAIGRGAAISLFMLPFLAVLALLMIRSIRRGD